MRLALKVVLATVLGVLSVLVGFGWFKVQREIALFDSDMRKDHRLIGATLAVCVADTWASSSESHALSLIARADAARPGLRIAWIHDDGRQDPRPPVFEYGNSPLTNQIDQIVRSDPAHPDGTQYLVTRIPVRNGDRQLGAVEIAESLEVRDAYIKASIWFRVEVTTVMLAVSGVIVLVLGVWLVGNPLRQLASKAKRIGQGDLGGPLSLTQRDEIGELAHEMNAMCERLSEATAKGEAAASARIRALEQLRHADRLSTVGRLAAGVAHELGTPLNVIAGRVKMLRRGGIEPTLTEEYLAIVAEQTERMTAIIRQLMDFARRREPKVQSVDLLTVARSIVRLVEPIARKRGVRVSVTSAERVLAQGDAAQLEHVVSNLVVNAIQACDDGGRVEISCERDATPSDAERVRLQVSDDGHGMNADTIERVFEPFFTTKDVGQGTGLGLSVAHGIIEEHGGSISVQSELRHGSTFSVVLPAVSQ